MKIRAVLMDMDGTLLGRSQVAVSARNMAVLQQAIEKGVHVIPCTGRVYNMLPPQLLTQRGLRYFVTSHGARAYDRDTNTSVYEDLIPAEESAQLLALLEGKYLYNEIAANGTIYLEKAVADNPNMSVVPEHHIWYVRDNCFTAVERPSEYFRTHGVAVEKMNIYGIPQAMQQDIFDAITATGFIKHTRGAAAANLEFSHYTRTSSTPPLPFWRSWAFPMRRPWRSVTAAAIWRSSVPAASALPWAMLPMTSRPLPTM